MFILWFATYTVLLMARQDSVEACRKAGGDATFVQVPSACLRYESLVSGVAVVLTQETVSSVYAGARSNAQGLPGASVREAVDTYSVNSTYGLLILLLSFVRRVPHAMLGLQPPSHGGRLSCFFLSSVRKMTANPQSGSEAVVREAFGEQLAV